MSNFCNLSTSKYTTIQSFFVINCIPTQSDSCECVFDLNKAWTWLNLPVLLMHTLRGASSFKNQLWGWNVTSCRVLRRRSSRVFTAVQSCCISLNGNASSPANGSSSRDRQSDIGRCSLESHKTMSCERELDCATIYCGVITQKDSQKKNALLTHIEDLMWYNVT